MRVKVKRLLAVCGGVLLVLVVAAVGCRSAQDTDAARDSRLGALVTAATAVFAPYNEPAVRVTPAVPAYRVAADLGNVINRDRFDFSPAARESLVKNGFVVLPADHREFFWVYEMNSYLGEPTPSFVTTDAMLHNYHLYFSHLLRTLEKDKLYGELQALTALMREGSVRQYQALKGTDWENAAQRNLAFFSVAARLLDPAADIHPAVRETVERELDLIADADAVMFPSPVMNMGALSALSQSPLETFNEDYTQYTPRGHYTKCEELENYFQTMMWYGRMTFRARSEDETRSAALITTLLGREGNSAGWQRIYEPTNFLVGKSDDLGFIEYGGALEETYGGRPTLEELTTDAARWATFRAAVDKLAPPALNSIPIFDADIQPDRDGEIKGFRFMGQRFTLDASVFQRLVYREVEENSAGERRMLPRGLDIPAAMGSDEAYAILDDLGETDYKNYPENMRKMRAHIADLDDETRVQNLYWSWLHTLAPLTAPKGEGYPSFMTNQAWTRKQLETYLGSWAELKHDTILYAKQVYAEMGGGGEQIDDRGYVEPNPAVYARLAALTRMTIDGLESRDLLEERDRTALERMEELALQLKTIAEKELAGELPTDKEFDLIRGFGGSLEHFWMEALRDEGVDHPSAMYENPACLIADVATDPAGAVLEVGTGHISEIYAVVPVDGTLRIAKGAVYAYHEFSRPARDRLTDEKWRAMLDDGQAPPPPVWTGLYTVRAD